MSSEGEDRSPEESEDPSAAESEGDSDQEIVERLVEELLGEDGENSGEDFIDGLVEGLREEEKGHELEVQTALLEEPGKDIDEDILDKLVAQLVEKAPKRRYTGIEERKHVRFSVTGLAHLTVEGGEPQKAYLANLSRGGAGLYTHEQLKSDQEVVLDLSLIKEHWMHSAMKFPCRIRYSFKVGEVYLTGMEFEKTTSRQFAYLLTFLRHMWDLQDR